MYIMNTPPKKIIIPLMEINEYRMVVEKTPHHTTASVCFIGLDDLPVEIPTGFRIYNDHYKIEIQPSNSHHFMLCWDDSYTMLYHNKVLKRNQHPLWNFITEHQ